MYCLSTALRVSLVLWGGPPSSQVCQRCCVGSVAQSPPTALPRDCCPAMQPILHRFAPTVVESGFENFKMTFKWSEYCCRCLHQQPAAATCSRVGSPVAAQSLQPLAGKSSARPEPPLTAASALVVATACAGTYSDHLDVKGNNAIVIYDAAHVWASGVSSQLMHMGTAAAAAPLLQAPALPPAVAQAAWGGCCPLSLPACPPPLPASRCWSSATHPLPAADPVGGCRQRHHLQRRRLHHNDRH